MSVYEHGFILKKLPPGDSKFSVLTQSRGKLIIAIPPQTNMRLLNIGSRIQFVVSDQQYNVHIVNNIQLVDSLHSPMLADLVWMHHLLELCYYFVPLHQLSHDCFEFLVQCNILLALQAHFQDMWESIKRICIGILLCIVGFYPSDELLSPILALKGALLRFIDFEDMQNIELITETVQKVCIEQQKKFEQWMLEYIETHPRREAFKTLNFMYNSLLLPFTEG